jgi:putative membrane protein
MILPGISGAFVLLLLGLYHPITDLIKGLPRLSLSANDYLIIATFGIGCLVGLLSFSRLLRWLLAHRHDGTMAFLSGLMIGSLYKIWPFQRVVPATADLPFKEQQYENIWPYASNASLPIVIGLVATAAVLTLLLERWGSKFAKTSHESE